MGLISKQLLKVIEWIDDRSDLIIYKFPMTDRAEIMTGSQLTVREGQVAIFMKDGRIADVFAPGRYKLETKNLPILTGLGAWKYGFKSPFKADVYFVHTTQFSGQKWGTQNPFTMRDPEFGVIRIRAYGKYSFKITDAKLFMLEMAGAKREFTTDKINEHLRTLVITNISDIIADSKYSAIDLSSKLTQFNEIAKTSLQQYFSAIGMSLVSFAIENISFPENVEKAIDERSSVGIMSDKMGSYVQMQQAQAMRDAAQNPGGLSGMFMGMGVGGGLAGGMMGANSAMNQAADTSKSGIGVSSGGFCTKCGAKMSPGAKFCPECGAKQGDNVCPKCNHAIEPGAKFCPECGTKIG